MYSAGTEPGLPNVSVDMIVDVNKDGLWDSGDVYVAALSNSDGEFHFSGLLPNCYLVRVSDTLAVLRHFAPTVTATTGSTPVDNTNKAQPFSIGLAAGETNNLADFGYREYEVFGTGSTLEPGMIGDQIWLDVNGNSSYEPVAGDQPISGVTVEARRGGVVVSTATTGSDGKYLLLDLPLGQSYEVRVTDLFGVLAAYQPVAPGNPGQNHQSQAQPYAVALGFANSNTTADFGYRPAGSRFTLTQQLLTPGPVRAGETISYSIRITNTGSTIITDLPLAEKFDNDFLGYITASVAPNSGPARAQVKQLVWTDMTGAGELAPGASLEVRVAFVGILDTSHLPGSTTAVTATVSGVMADMDGASGSAPRFLTILPAQSSQSSVQIVNPTAVLGVNGQAQTTVSGVELTWQTQNETDIIGFHLVRVGGDGRQTLNNELIWAQASGQPTSNSYHFTDSHVTSGESYEYILQILQTDQGMVEFSLGTVIAQWYLFMSQIVR